ncbi:MAG: hypothetical protein HUJ68_04450 [Clostridia bacterium]|nr:hypothetical protein [Clostridia bacterium]
MDKNRILKISGATLNKEQLKTHLQKMASNHSIVEKTDKSTYPVPHMLENFNFIQEVYKLLNEHVKIGISIHPAGEWLLDNFYIIEETVKQIQKNLSLKKYENLLGLGNGQYKGFARIYVLAGEIVAYTENKIEKSELEEYLLSYQRKKNLSMEEIWNIGIFLQIVIIENIREVCERIYISQIEKYKAENMAERLIENKTKTEQKYKSTNIKKLEKNILEDLKYPFVEYMSYILKRYGKKGYSYLKILEETVELKGTTVSEIIKKEHFDIATRKVSIGNSIISIKKIQRINFLEIFEKINEVEELLRKDPSNVYEKMDSKTKEYYRNRIKEISKKTKISEIYIAKKILEISGTKKEGSKQRHIGYYLIEKGINELYGELKYKNQETDKNKKAKIYISIITLTSIILSILSTYTIKTNTIWQQLIAFILFLIPASEVSVQIVQFILSKTVKPKLIPKMDFTKGIPKEYATMVEICDRISDLSNELLR